MMKLKIALIMILSSFSLTSLAWHFTDADGNYIPCNSGEIPVVNVFGGQIFSAHSAFGSEMTDREAFEHVNGSATSCQKCQGYFNGKIDGSIEIMRCASGTVDSCLDTNGQCPDGHICVNHFYNDKQRTSCLRATGNNTYNPPVEEEQEEVANDDRRNKLRERFAQRIKLKKKHKLKYLKRKKR